MQEEGSCEDGGGKSRHFVSSVAEQNPADGMRDEVSLHTQNTISSFLLPATVF